MPEFNLDDFRSFASEMFDGAAEGDRSELDAEIRQAEKQREIEEMMERKQAEKLHRKLTFGTAELSNLTAEQKDLLVKYGFARMIEPTEAEYGKLEIVK